MSTGFGCNARGSAATDADDPPVPCGQVLFPRPDLPIEVVEIGAPAERRRGRGRWLAMHGTVCRIASGVALLDRHGIRPRHELDGRDLLSPLLSEFGHRDRTVHAEDGRLRPAELYCEVQNKLVEFLAVDVTAVEGGPDVGLDGIARARGPQARQGDPAAVTGGQHPSPPHFPKDEANDTYVDIRRDGIGTGRGHDVLVLGPSSCLAFVSICPDVHVVPFPTSFLSGQSRHWPILVGALLTPGFSS